MRHIEVTPKEAKELLTRSEDHYLDFKSKKIKPASLEKSVSAFGNSSGGEIIIGVHEDPKGEFKWEGFDRIEDTNSHVNVLIGPYPPSDTFQYDTLTADGFTGFLLRITIAKTREICRTASGDIYIRGTASVKHVVTDDALKELELQKGIYSYEDATTRAPLDLVTNSYQITDFVVEALTFTEPEPWLRQQLMIVADKPTVAAVVLFADEPQVVLPKASVMVYRYASREKIGSRETLVDGKTWNIEGSAINQITQTVAKTAELIESVKGTNLQNVIYPPETLHEIITNAVIHRDYSIADNIHVRIFDDRVEVQSPGRLAGHVTPNNLPGARFSRNETIERMLHKFPDAPNKNVGEGLVTAFKAMEAMRLTPPEVVETTNGVIVYIKHEAIDSPSTIVLRYLEDYETITNKEARTITNIQSEGKMRRVLTNLITQNALEQVPGTTKGGYKYRIN